ncbi:MAG: hypothetical protein EON51_01950 [Acinetobacter sp.]|nr:MAG: hypothetical protein EON51_01950 [Acinetobacter sp.]
MKIANISLLSISLLLLVSISAVVLNLPAPLKLLDFSGSGNLGSAVAGLCTPVIGILSTVLLYMALTKQTQSNIDQRVKNESDVIFMLINQLDQELERFYTKISKTTANVKTEYTETGIQGLMHFTRFYKFELNKEWLDENEMTFKSFYESHQVILLIDSFMLIEKRISISEISSEMRDLFTKKLESYYQCRFRLPLKYLSQGFEKYGQNEQEYSKKVLAFIATQKNEGEIFD